MNWDEKAMARAELVYEDWTTKPRYAERRIYRQAARWQREQLRTPEAIELGARAMFDHDAALCHVDEDEWADDRLAYEESFAIGLTALLGED